MSLDDLLEQLKKEYLEDLPHRSQTIDRLLKEENWKGLASEFHKLKGTGKTYGVPEVSEISQLLEDHCKHSPVPNLEAIGIYRRILQRIIESYATNPKDYILHKDQDFQKLQAMIARS